MNKFLTFVAFFGFFFAGPHFAQAKTIRYELNVTRGDVNLSGKATVDWALMVNGSIPAPTLEFTEGDDAEIVVNNKLANEEVSIHWHGILLPPEMDGVAYVNTPPIFPGKSFTFKFRLRQSGTYWYHSHTMLQEQKGVYGGIVIHPKKKTIAYDKEAVVVLSDWSDENPDQIIKNLRKDGDYYLYKKDSMRSWLGAIQHKALGTYLHNEWTRMGGMDLSDVGYDAFLINGKRDSQLIEAHPGEKIRLRIINAAASSYFYVSLGQVPMTVISADGLDIAPVTTNEILMGMAETYDVLFEVPAHKNFELRATAQDVTGFASAWIGMGLKAAAAGKSLPNMYESMDHGSMNHATHSVAAPDQATPMDRSNHSGHSTSSSHSGHSGHGNAVPSSTAKASVETLTVDQLRSPQKTNFPEATPKYDLKLVLGGDMERYVWHINGKTIAQDRTIQVREGDVVRFTFVNETMMHHPMHLHGHFFRVLNDGNEFSPLKHTVDVPPHGTRTIEFLANEPGEWMLHCHNLYHMKTGMARVMKYTTYTPKPEIAEHQKHDPHLHEHIYVDGRVEAATNHAQANLRLSRTWDTLEAAVEMREYENTDHSEADIFYRRWFGNYLNLIAGGTYVAEIQEPKARAVAGIGYILPMLVETNLLVDHTGKLRLDLEKRFQWTKTVFTDAEVVFRQDEKTEFEISLMYGKDWHWSAGLMFTEDTAGLGAEYRF